MNNQKILDKIEKLRTGKNGAYISYFELKKILTTQEGEPTYIVHPMQEDFKKMLEHENELLTTKEREIENLEILAEIEKWSKRYEKEYRQPRKRIKGRIEPAYSGDFVKWVRDQMEKRDK